MLAINQNQYIYLYDLPKSRVTSIMISKIIKEMAGYELQDPVQFKDYRQRPQATGSEQDFCWGIIKVDPNQVQQVSKLIKYFYIDYGKDGNGQPLLWECRALPYDRDLYGGTQQRTNLNLDVIVKNIDPSITSKQLEEMFSSNFGDVKSAKISRSVKKLKSEGEEASLPTSNGYGYVCFSKSEFAEKAIEAGSINGMKIERYFPKDPNQALKIYNNIYVKNFNP